MTTRICTRCGAEFTLERQWCADGEPHVVEAKEYLILDTPGGRTFIGNIPPGPLPDNFRAGADDQNIGGMAEFIDGRFTTSDPEKQYWLDQRGGFITEEQWKVARMTADELEVFKVEKLRQEVAKLRKEVANVQN